MTSNQDQHFVYQQPYPANYQVPVAYIPYPHDPAYADKTTYAGYQSVAYQPPDNSEMIHNHNPYTQQYPQGQWSFQPPAQSHFIPTYATSFNVANDPAYQTAPPPNLNRPPPNIKHDDYQGSLGMLENPAHNAAAYTANWVSSTSSIPPEMRDEPESDVSIHQWEGRHNQGNWHSSNDENRRKGDKGSKSRDEPRELTFDERLQKARMQKDRVEQSNENSGVAFTSNQTGGLTRGGRYDRGGRGGGRGGNHNGAEKRKDLKSEDEHRSDGVYRPRRAGFHQGAVPSTCQQISYQQHPSVLPAPFVIQPFSQNVIDQNVLAAMNALQNTHIGNYPAVRQFQVMPGSFGVVRSGIQQEEKFRNTWLDAQNFPINYGPVIGMNGRGRGIRGRGRGGFSRGASAVRRNDRKEELIKKDLKKDGDLELSENEKREDSGKNSEDNSDTSPLAADETSDDDSKAKSDEDKPNNVEKKGENDKK